MNNQTVTSSRGHLDPEVYQTGPRKKALTMTHLRLPTAAAWPYRCRMGYVWSINEPLASGKIDSNQYYI